MTGELLKDLSDMGIQTKALIPSENNLIVKEKYKSKIITYDFGSNKFKKKINGIFPYSVLLNYVLGIIKKEDPDLVWTIDDKPFIALLGKRLSKQYVTYMTIHDLSFHPSYNQSLRNKVYLNLWGKYKKDYIDCSTGIITMSNNIYKQVLGLNKKVAQKTICLQLGAHIPDVNEKKPEEFNTVSFRNREYYLFFGRIDKYKGIDSLLNTYTNYNGIIDLVIAGSGVLQTEWMDIINRDKRILLINRYIKDAEMIWLIKNANAVILPYVEASQSGVIPIAYSYGVPVITSNVEGLTQNVERDSTGIICETIDDYIKAYYRLENSEVRINMTKNINSYYTEKFDWIQNLTKMIEQIEMTRM